MEQTLITLAKMHFALGLIGYDELRERLLVARWVSEAESGGGDPRGSTQEASREEGKRDSESGEYGEAVVARIKGGGRSSSEREDGDWLEYLCLGVWVFTKGDPDSYPSVPHGHFESKNNKWPKLNPYTGRVFAGKHQEDVTRRLNRKEMQAIWRDEKFKSFCREMIVWYQEQFPYYDFPVRHLFRLPKW